MADQEVYEATCTAPVSARKPLLRLNSEANLCLLQVNIAVVK